MIVFRTPALAVLALCSITAFAQTPGTYPSRTIRMIVPWPPGGSTDALARIVAARLTSAMGQQVIVDKRPGAGGNIGTAIAAKGSADGHVMVLVSSSFVVNPSLYSKVAAGANITHVPYTGATMMPAVIGGHVHTGFISVPAAQPHVASGALRALAITSLKRSPAMPDVPTFEESGYKGFEVDHMQGLLVPAGTPRAIVDRINQEIVKGLDDPEIKKRLYFLGFDPVGNKPDEFAQQIRVQLPKWEKLVKQAGIKVE